MKKRRILIALAAAVLLLALFFRAYQRAALLPGQLNGTYTLGDVPPYQLIFSANTREGVFYYTDQGNSRYITGRITPRGGGAYALTCQDPNNGAVLPDQIIACDGLTLLLKLYDITLPFEKNDSVTLQIGDSYS